MSKIILANNLNDIIDLMAEVYKDWQFEKQDQVKEQFIKKFNQPKEYPCLVERYSIDVFDSDEYEYNLIYTYIEELERRQQELDEMFELFEYVQY